MLLFLIMGLAVCAVSLVLTKSHFNLGQLFKAGSLGHKLFTCPFCLGFWVAAILSALNLEIIPIPLHLWILGLAGANAVICGLVLRLFGARDEDQETNGAQGA